ncbi:MAG: endonuclease III [Chlorobium sp.]|jgi:endonuclease-3|uniref:endonuclease III n=1 Tax=Chlorobium sp. TaxID=1095 RepID=UPI001DB0E76F|nr:endonuclease III [Chlorobium sp.]MBN1279581.1 endonuclease III [Chlorobiaceae bacterium]MCF8216466.1 endonuclease III [Chlorobium sp.]MCF8271368.1 endonuclease III [Chlorobium sp.]MCF8287743.1 endonuclease III [Chlorobium sp.]MCF8291279.1 endonuclease III [Chlorobium sp.]
MVTATKKKIIFIREKLGNLYPEPKSELIYETPFQLLIATILAAQSTDKQVNILTRELFKVCPDAKTMSLTDPETIRNLVRSINYYNNKAKNILAVSKKLIEEYEGEVPESREALESLPGVGRKTANVVLSNAFRQPVMPVDTHVHRVSNRLGLVNTSKPDDTEAGLIAIIPEEWVIDFHHYLLLHGRYTCKAKKTDCRNCVLRDICDWPEKA